MDRLVFLAMSVALQATTLYATYAKDSGMFATLFVVVLLVSAAFYLFQFGSLQEFSIGALSANAKFIRQKAEESKENAEVVAEQRVLIERTAKEVLDLKESLSKRVEELSQTANTAMHLAAQNAGMV